MDYGKRLVAAGLVQGTWGNLSMRLSEETMLVTPSGLDYNRLSPADMVKVDVRSLEHEGEHKPTSEKGFTLEFISAGRKSARSSIPIPNMPPSLPLRGGPYL